MIPCRNSILNPRFIKCHFIVRARVRGLEYVNLSKTLYLQEDLYLYKSFRKKKCFSDYSHFDP